MFSVGPTTFQNDPILVTCCDVLGVGSQNGQFTAISRLGCRSFSIEAIRSDNVMSRRLAISFNPFQNASSRLTLVLWAARATERLMTTDFIASTRGGSIIEMRPKRLASKPCLFERR